MHDRRTLMHAPSMSCDLGAAGVVGGLRLMCSTQMMNVYFCAGVIAGMMVGGGVLTRVEWIANDAKGTALDPRFGYDTGNLMHQSWIYPSIGASRVTAQSVDTGRGARL